MIPVFILIRTSGRPKFFTELMKSIKAQTYPNIVTIVHSDDPKDTYVTGDIVIHGKKQKGRGAYNLYMNTLMLSIPKKTPGWFVFIDDDDMYIAPDVIERFVASAKPNHINVARVKRGKNTIWPKFWRKQKSFQTECFMLHTKYRKVRDKHGKLIQWWNKTGGDHHYTGQITKILPINWIDGLIVARAQDGKNRGARRDLGDPKPARR